MRFDEPGESFEVISLLYGGYEHSGMVLFLLRVGRDGVEIENAIESIKKIVIFRGKFTTEILTQGTCIVPGCYFSPLRNLGREE